jgi:hypothetical protein
MNEIITETKKFEVHKVDNGFTIFLEYTYIRKEDAGKENPMEWTGYKTLVANNIEEVHNHFNEWFGKI